MFDKIFNKKQAAETVIFNKNFPFTTLQKKLEQTKKLSETWWILFFNDIINDVKKDETGLFNKEVQPDELLKLKRYLLNTTFKGHLQERKVVVLQHIENILSEYNL